MPHPPGKDIPKRRIISLYPYIAEWFRKNIAETNLGGLMLLAAEDPGESG
jgi:hypothetical protein